jgi:hypothetical protein
MEPHHVTLAYMPASCSTPTSRASLVRRLQATLSTWLRFRRDKAWMHEDRVCDLLQPRTVLVSDHAEGGPTAPARYLPLHECTDDELAKWSVAGRFPGLFCHHSGHSDADQLAAMLRTAARDRGRVCEAASRANDAAWEHTDRVVEAVDHDFMGPARIRLHRCTSSVGGDGAGVEASPELADLLGFLSQVLTYSPHYRWFKFYHPLGQSGKASSVPGKFDFVSPIVTKPARWHVSPQGAGWMSSCVPLADSLPYVRAMIAAAPATRLCEAPVLAAEFQDVLGAPMDPEAARDLTAYINFARGRS